ncbi:MAG: 4a-hydroxytetrahydrobiopterin dehydratase [bacterium]|nr:4a-hydroxytetrahydrobiopterin dehydratase [bacterium]
MKKVLKKIEIKDALKKLPEWKLVNGKLVSEFVFSDFRETIAFMVRTSFYIEEKNHHPEWSNVYNKLKVNYISHDVAGITLRDLEMARIFSKIYGKSFKKK